MASPKTLLKVLTSGLKKRGQKKFYDRVRAMVKARRRFPVTEVSQLMPARDLVAGNAPVFHTRQRGFNQDQLAPELVEALKEHVEAANTLGIRVHELDDFPLEIMPAQHTGLVTGPSGHKEVGLKSHSILYDYGDSLGGQSPIDPTTGAAISFDQMMDRYMDARLMQNMASESASRHAAGGLEAVFSIGKGTSTPAELGMTEAEEVSRRLTQGGVVPRGHWLTARPMNPQGLGGESARHETLHGLLTTMTPEEAKSMGMPFRAAHSLSRKLQRMGRQPEAGLVEEFITFPGGKRTNKRRGLSMDPKADSILNPRILRSYLGQTSLPGKELIPRAIERKRDIAAAAAAGGGTLGAYWLGRSLED